MPGDDTTSASAGSKDTTSSTPTTSTGPIQIRNLSVSSAGTSAEITFVLKNTGSERIERVQQVTIDYGGASSFMTQCGSSSYYSWTIAPGATSSVITLTLTDYGDSSPYISTPCGTANGDATTKPWTGDLTLEIKGLLGDATPWKARASATP